MPAVEQDLTQGSVTRKLVRYALPLVASSLLQAIYSITDIIIAGHYIGDVGISAINNASIMMNRLTQLAIGLTVGGNVLVGQYFGSGDHENRRKSAGNMLTVGLISMDDGSKQVMVDGAPVSLTPIEYNIVKLLLSHPGQVFSSAQIYEQVWNDPAYGSENTVAVHIRHLREKLEIDPANPRYIKVVWGLGYKMEKV